MSVSLFHERNKNVKQYNFLPSKSYIQTYEYNTHAVGLNLTMFCTTIQCAAMKMVQVWYFFFIIILLLRPLYYEALASQTKAHNFELQHLKQCI